MILMPKPILVVSQTPGTVFPARPDRAGLRGDRRLGSHPPCRPSECRDNCDNCDSHRTNSEQHHISYSVKYFNYSVSTSEDEAEVVTVTLNRMKIRRSSRERNDKNLKDKDRQA